MKSLNLVPGYTTIDNSEKAIAIYRRYMVARKGETKRDEASKSFFFLPPCKTWKKRNECPNSGGISIKSSDGAPYRKGCMANGQMTKGK